MALEHRLPQPTMEVPRRFPWKILLIASLVFVLVSSGTTLATLSQTIWKSVSEAVSQIPPDQPVVIPVTTPTPAPTEAPIPTPTPLPYNIYVITFHWIDNNPHLYDNQLAIQYDLFTKKIGIPAKNIIQMTTRETATPENFKNAVDQIATKAAGNDLVLVQIATHDYTLADFAPNDDLLTAYKTLSEWLDEIHCRAIIVTVYSCQVDDFGWPLREGTSPRIVYTAIDYEFAMVLGETPLFYTTADTDYGNNDGILTLDEIGRWIETLSYDKSAVGGTCRMFDATGIASTISFGNYKP